MPFHAGAVTPKELDQIVQQDISEPMGCPAEVRQYRDPINDSTQVLCNGVLLKARSNYQMKCLIREMKRYGTLIAHFKRKTFFQEGI